MWTMFWDMHSGGGQKLEWAMIYVEAPRDEAKLVFQNAFGRNPERVTCTCCGGDYSIDSHESLAQLTGFHRGCRNIKTPRLSSGLFDNDNPVVKAHLYLEEGEDPPEGFEVEADVPRLHAYQRLEQFIKREDVKVIPASEIRPEWRKGELREEGYVWRGPE